MDTWKMSMQALSDIFSNICLNCHFILTWILWNEILSHQQKMILFNMYKNDFMILYAKPNIYILFYFFV